MPFDGIVTSGIVRELNQMILNGKIDKIYQPENDEIILHIRANAENYKLLISANSNYSRLHLMSGAKNNPETAPNFCMFLRKHIQGGKISSIRQKELERIVEIYIDSYNELGYPSQKKLVIEIMGKHSNIILVDTDTLKILDCIKKISLDVNRYRQILPGKDYILPPDQGKVPPLNIDRQLFAKKINEANISIIKAIYQSFQGLSPFISRQICESAGIEEEMPSHSITASQKEILFEQMSKICRCIKEENYKPCIMTDCNNNVKDFYALTTKWMKEHYIIHNYDSLSAVVQTFYFQRDAQNRLKQKSADLNKHIHSIIAKLGLKKQKLTEEILKAEAAETYKLYGELINANIYRLTEGSSKVLLENYHNPGEEILITLDPQLTPPQNAQKYFKKYNKSKTAYKKKRFQLEETHKELIYMESVLQSIKDAESPQDIEEIRQELMEEGYIRVRYTGHKKRNKHSQPLNFTSSDGFEILVGKNNKQNDTLTLKTASKSDIWFHTKEIPGSHVILCCKGKEPSEKSIFEAASLAAYHSKGKMSENVPVDYTLVKNVKKPNGAKPGMVVYDHYHTVYVDPKEKIN